MKIYSKLIESHAPVIQYGAVMYQNEEQKALNKKAKRINKRTKIGLMILCTGFLFQLTSNFV